MLFVITVTSEMDVKGHYYLTKLMTYLCLSNMESKIFSENEVFYLTIDHKDCVFVPKISGKKKCL